jgi:cytochrome P450
MRLAERTQRITLEVILRAVFGVEAERMTPLREAIAAVTEPIQRVTFVLMALRRPSDERPPGSIRGNLERLDAVIYEEIDRRRSEGDLAERMDILSLLLQARDEEGQAMTDAELRDELVSLLLAGHETTATSVAWAVERLVRHPEKLARLQAEIDELGAMGGEYMAAVVSETLRVRPVVPIVVRLLAQELEVGGYLLEAGTYVAPSIYLTNRNARIYEDPRAFRPERFLEDAPETFSWIPFGGGIRRCIGASFAQVEMKLILGTILSELSPRLAGRRARAGEWVRRRAVTLVPGSGARVAWERRSPQGPGRSGG